MIRNLSLYPAELRGQRRKQPFMDDGPRAQAEQKVIRRHRAARWRHNPGHKVAVPEGGQLANDFNASLRLATPGPAIEFVADFLLVASNFGGVK